MSYVPASFPGERGGHTVSKCSRTHARANALHSIKETFEVRFGLTSCRRRETNVMVLADIYAHPGLGNRSVFCPCCSAGNNSFTFFDAVEATGSNIISIVSCTDPLVVRASQKTCLRDSPGIETKRGRQRTAIYGTGAPKIPSSRGGGEYPELGSNRSVCYPYTVRRPWVNVRSFTSIKIAIDRSFTPVL